MVSECIAERGVFAPVAVFGSDLATAVDATFILDWRRARCWSFTVRSFVFPSLR